MRRRQFIAGLGSAVAWPLTARAQQARKLLTIGLLGTGSPSTQGQWVTGFVQRLHELESCGLLDRQIGGLGAFKDFIDEYGRAAER